MRPIHRYRRNAVHFIQGTIPDVVVKDLAAHSDPRGWLVELFREDDTPPQYRPVMGYISYTKAGVARGPHEHVDQADYFAFLGPSTFRIYLWDSRPGSPTSGVRQVLVAGESAPKSIIIPAGIVHAYLNIGTVDGMVVNFPNRLYAGRGKKEPVDEVRHENDPHSVYRLD